jgi:hypothetical protein
VLSFSSSAVIVRLSPTPAPGVADAAPMVKWVAAPTVTFAWADPLVEFQACHCAVTV